MRAIHTPRWTWFQKQATRPFPSVAASSEHRLVWGWMRLVLGLTQMAFSVTAVVLVIFSGFTWRALVAISLAGAAAGASRYLYAGRPDPRLEGAVKRDSNGDART
jgi:hypothetical protein